VLSQQVEFVPERDTEVFAAVPAAPAVFLLRSWDPQAEPYVSKTANLRRRLQRILCPPSERSKKLNLRDRVRYIEYQPTGSDFESGLLLYETLRATFPRTYATRLRLRFAPLIKLHLNNPYPRASITTRLGRVDGRNAYYGPFASRALAEKFANDSLDFFKMRRCVDDLHPDPKFPGCIYSEMKMCLAPCFKGCTDEEYESEVSRVRAYFESGGESLVKEISTRRDAASANLEFENAAALHVWLEKISPVLRQLPEIIRRVDTLWGVIIQRSAVSESVNLFHLQSGLISGPMLFPIQPAEHGRSQSMEARVTEAIAGIPMSDAKTVLRTMEHLALLRRWYYRSSRAGEIFLADEKGVLPLRRIVRGISRVYRGEKLEPGEVKYIDTSRPEGWSG